MTPLNSPCRQAWRPGMALAALTLGLCALAQPAAAVSVGDAAPDFQLSAVPDGRGGPAVLNLRELRGRVVYLDFWASWCGPCKQSFPWMNALQQRYGAQGLQVVAVNLDERNEDARRFLAKVPAQFRVAFDGAGDTPKRYAILGMPTSVLIGADGRVLKVHAGFNADDTAALESAIQQALAR
jgi:cytochrome c biogenesis protein CcmG, thiol:disulfide interchange protein DsbE